MTTPSANPVRVLVVADDLLARAGLAAVLAAQPGCDVVGQVSGSADLGFEIEVHRPDTLVWDLGWDPSHALERLPDLREAGVPVVVLLSNEEHAGEAWAVGARGLLSREASAEEIAAALQAMAHGLAVIDPVMGMPRVATPAPGAQSPRALAEPLTPREIEVLRLLADGLPNKAIASRLGVSDHTVKFHINAILGKLNAQSRTEAVVLAARIGLITL